MNDNVKTIKNWYEEKYDKLVVQRNLLLISLFALLILAIVAIITISVVIASKTFDPFVIQIDENTGMAKVVNPASSDILNANETLSRYFVKKYVVARESYNPVDYDQERKLIRLFSADSVWWNYVGYTRNKNNDPTLIYGQKNTTYLTVKSWTRLEDSKEGKRYMLRFAINETAGEQKVYNKIAVIDYKYTAMELTDADMDINPVGFQVIGYRVDDDNS